MTSRTHGGQPVAEESGRRDSEALEEKASAEYRRRSDITFLECAVALLVTDFGIEETAKILCEEASILLDHG